MSWKVVKIGELIENFSVKAKDYNIDVSTLDFFGVSNTDGITSSKYAAENKANDYKILEKNCFAYNPYRVNVGSIAMLDKDIVGLISPAYVVFKIKEKSIIPELLLKFLKSSEGLRQIKLHARGTVRQALRFSDLCNIEISLPNYDEQKEFYKTISNTEIECSILSTELTHQLSLVKQLRQAFLREAMQGKLIEQNPNDEPATELLAKIKAEKEQLIKVKKIKKQKPLPTIEKEEIPFEIPENWVWCRLGETGDLLRGKSKHRPRNDARLFNKGQYPFIQTGDVARSKTNAYLINTINGYYNDFGLAQSTILDKGTLCITIAANIAEIGFLGFDACAPDSIVYFKSLSEYIKKYVFYYILDAQEEIEKYAPATSQKNINLGILNNLLIPLPPLSEQKRIVAKLDELMAYCDSLEESIKNSQTQNEMLLGQVLREALEPKEKEVVV